MTERVRVTGRFGVSTGVAGAGNGSKPGSDHVTNCCPMRCATSCLVGQRRGLDRDRVGTCRERINPQPASTTTLNTVRFLSFSLSLCVYTLSLSPTSRPAPSRTLPLFTLASLVAPSLTEPLAPLRLSPFSRVKVRDTSSGLHPNPFPWIPAKPYPTFHPTPTVFDGPAL
jgi:hypothetical protein